ncbi:hypothetical protein Q7C36_011443 [Tachysurus vachellii]|uniref:Uncharacterized protein n=1 Tax=Tachysurus vachellii TaxID=175792 RepID=A0AA88SS08_TACVA|nr:hypothetical protein Q7C36_011440 [Tachysurus vachellii]KAK2843227.1 hypothetical protein Q7C36_011442 [Tachysurus vachellii]KAK2843228.1 hypothetical protein Q7C36_011443 [Tachysurus vachellii]
MAVRGFLPDLKSWTVGEIARAAGLVAFSAGAGYCIYRSLRRERAPPDRTQPSHEPVDVLRESLDTPSLLQQTIKQVTCTYLFVGKDGQMDTSTWEKEEVPVPYAVIPCFTPDVYLHLLLFT